MVYNNIGELKQSYFTSIAQYRFVINNIKSTFVIKIGRAENIDVRDTQHHSRYKVPKGIPHLGSWTYWIPYLVVKSDKTEINSQQEVENILAPIRQRKGLNFLFENNTELVCCTLDQLKPLLKEAAYQEKIHIVQDQLRQQSESYITDIKDLNAELVSVYKELASAKKIEEKSNDQLNTEKKASHHMEKRIESLEKENETHENTIIELTNMHEEDIKTIAELKSILALAEEDNSDSESVDSTEESKKK